MTKKRERLEVIRDILEAVKENRSIKPTRLLYASNLSPQMFRDYIAELIEKDMIKMQVETEEKENEKIKASIMYKGGKIIKDNEREREGVQHKTISITKKGFEFLEKYKVIEGFVNGFGL